MNTGKPRLRDVDPFEDGFRAHFLAMGREFFRPMIHPIDTVKETRDWCKKAFLETKEGINKIIK